MFGCQLKILAKFSTGNQTFLIIIKKLKLLHYKRFLFQFWEKNHAFLLVWICSGNQGRTDFALTGIPGNMRNARWNIYEVASPHCDMVLQLLAIPHFR